MNVRQASVGDADGMRRVLREIISITGQERRSDEAFVTAQYILNPDSVLCNVAVDEAGEILGFQSLVMARPENRYQVPEGWGIIGTHVSPKAHRRGVGSALFASSQRAAIDAGLKSIDAYIGADNAPGLSYYETMGFRTYRTQSGIIQKVFEVRPAAA